MGLFSFIKEAGEKLFGGKDAQAATPAASPGELNSKAAAAIENYIHVQKLGVSNLKVSYDASQGKVTVAGEAPTQAIKEKSHPVLRQRGQRHLGGQPDDGDPPRTRSPVPRRGAR